MWLRDKEDFDALEKRIAECTMHEHEDPKKKINEITDILDDMLDLIRSIRCTAGALYLDDTNENNG